MQFLCNFCLFLAEGRPRVDRGSFTPSVRGWGLWLCRSVCRSVYRSVYRSVSSPTLHVGLSSICRSVCRSVSSPTLHVGLSFGLSFGFFSHIACGSIVRFLLPHCMWVYPRFIEMSIPRFVETNLQIYKFTKKSPLLSRAREAPNKNSNIIS